MSEQRYNHELKVTQEDFENSNYLNILDEAKKDGYSGYWTVLSSSARKEAENGNENISKVLWLLADACSMMLKPDTLSEPFRPMIIMSGKRSALPEDFSNEDIEFFESIVENCQNHKLQARIADILWLLKKPKNVNHLKIALEAYSKFSLTYDDILTDSREAFQRAVRLALSTKQPIDVVVTLLLDSFNKAVIENGFHCLWINDLLSIAKIESSHYQKIIDKLESFASEFIVHKEWRKAREYYQAAREWHKGLNDPSNVNRLTKEVAETFVMEAEGRRDSQMVAASFLENAIQEYRDIPIASRGEFNADKRIEELYQQMTHANKLALNELTVVKTEGIDITEFVEESRKAVQSKELDEAMLSLANISTNPIYQNIKKEAERLQKSSPLSSLFSATHYSHDGRVVGKRAGVNLDDNESDSFKESVDYQVIQQYSIHFGLAVQGNIIPAYQQLIAEHRVTKSYMLNICSNSSVVPRNRANVWAEGLYFGFEQRFLVASHLLIPQIEHLVRVLLKQIPVKTTTLDANGIETEKGLSKLLEEQRLSEVVDENLIVLMDILLSNQLGFNLRNNIAHGLAEGSFVSADHIYLWWFCLQLVVNNSTLIGER